MGRSRYRIYEIRNPHFLTCTIINWIPVFTRPDTAQIILDSLAFLQRERGLRLYGYVILENHMHWIADLWFSRNGLDYYRSLRYATYRWSGQDGLPRWSVGAR